MMFVSRPKKKVFLLLALHIVCSVYPNEQETVTLQQAIARILEYNREIKAAYQESVAVQHDLNQAAMLQNPLLEVETENLAAGSTRLTLSQPVRLGGKREARIRMARADSLKAAAEFAFRRARIMAEAHRRFYNALGHQKQIEQLGRLILFAESTKTTIKNQVENGRAGKSDLLRSMKDITLLNIERNTLVGEYENHLISLCALWGGTRDTLKSVSGEIRAAAFFPMRDSLMTYIDRSPLWQAALADIEAAKARAVRHAEGVPDITVKGGMARDADKNDNSFSLGASFNLPLFDRNREAIRAARNKTEAADEKAGAVRNELYSEWMRHLGNIKRLEFKAVALKDTVILQTAEVLAELKLLFEAGQCSYRELVTAQQELVEAWRDYLNTETEIRLALADILELTGQAQ